MPGHVHYALIDEQSRIVARSPRLNHYAHSLDCPDRRSCLVYDLWDINPRHHAIWNMMHDLHPTARQNIIDVNADDAQKKTLEDLITFIKSGSSNIFETPLLQDARTFGVSNIYGRLTSITKGPVALHAFFLFSLYIFSVIIFHQNVYYKKIGDREYARQGGALAPGLNGIHPFAAAITMFVMWTIPVWLFVLMILVYITLLCYVHKRASGIAARKLAASAQATNQEAVNSSSTEYRGT